MYGYPLSILLLKPVVIRIGLSLQSNSSRLNCPRVVMFADPGMLSAKEPNVGVAISEYPRASNSFLMLVKLSKV